MDGVVDFILINLRCNKMICGKTEKLSYVTRAEIIIGWFWRYMYWIIIFVWESLCKEKSWI
jgi:hypothetical protein